MNTSIKNSTPPSCQRCFFSSVCSSENLSEKVVQTKLSLRRGDILHQLNDPFKNFYAIQTGTIKSYDHEESGRERIKQFYFPGEIFGFEAISSGQYPVISAAVTDTSVCEISFHDFSKLIETQPAFQPRLFKLFSQHLGLGDYLTYSHAEQRVVGFLLELYDRLDTKTDEITLTMSRQDIGNYLGLAAETVIRILTQLQRSKLIVIKNKTIKFLNLKHFQNLYKNKLH